MQQEGLYWKIQCRCKLSGEVIYKVHMNSGNRSVDLGVLVPGRECFEIDTRIPVKRIGTGDFSFQALPRNSNPTGKFVPIYPDEPFAYIQSLQKAYLQVRNGQVGVVMPEIIGSAPDQPDSGQSQKSDDKWEHP